MADQETLPGAGAPAFDPLQHGLWARFLTTGLIDHAAWMRACAEHAFVGTCRACGDYLVPLRPDEVAGRTDYTARCRRGNEAPGAGCGHLVVAPGGRVLRRSSLHCEMPPGWWDHRLAKKEV